MSKLDLVSYLHTYERAGHVLLLKHIQASLDVLQPKDAVGPVGERYGLGRAGVRCWAKLRKTMLKN